MKKNVYSNNQEVEIGRGNRITKGPEGTPLVFPKKYFNIMG